MKEKLRIYVLTPSFPPTLGGQENHLLELSDSLIAAGADLRVLTRRVERAVPSIEMLGRVPVRRLTPFGPIKGVGIRAAPRLGALLFKMMWRLVRDRHEYDVVLVSGFNFMPMAPVVAGLLTRRPCVVRPESPLEITEPIGADSRRKMRLGEHSFAMRMLSQLRRGAARRVDRYVAISSEIRANLERVGIDAERITDVPNGIAVQRFAPVAPAAKLQLRAKLGLPRDRLLMIYTGRLAVSKGVMMLIRVWREVAADFPLAHLLIVGTGEGSFDDCEPALRRYIAEHEFGLRVTLTGSAMNVNEYLQASDLFVFPSDYEGFSLSILEAMTAGLSLVSTRVGVAAELEHSCCFGLLVPPLDPAAFRDALRQLLSDPVLREQMGAAGRAAVFSKYSLAIEADSYLNLLSELCGSQACGLRP